MAADRERLGALDGLRGLAALTVAVIVHYRYISDPLELAPLYGFLPMRWLYLNGDLSVDLFFVVSGMVFTFKYQAAIARGGMDARTFFVLRMSRLYPLHVLTLVWVAVVQGWRLRLGQEALIYGNNDAFHFVLNLLFLQGGWFDQGQRSYSFNGPSWSIAIEFFLYVLFFVLAVAAAGRRYAAACGALVGTGALIVAMHAAAPFANSFMARGLMGFFAGSLAFMAIRRLRGRGHDRLLGWGAAGLLVVAGLLRHRGSDALGGQVWYGVIVLPLLATTALTWTPLGRVLSHRVLTYLGDISYSVYLVHMPLQIVGFSVVEMFRWTLPAGHVLFMAGYGATVVAAGALSYRCFEMPAQSWLRRRYRERFQPVRRPAASLAGDDIESDSKASGAVTRRVG